MVARTDNLADALRGVVSSYDASPKELDPLMDTKIPGTLLPRETCCARCSAIDARLLVTRT
jgi:hypothetical protein